MAGKNGKPDMYVDARAYKPGYNPSFLASKGGLKSPLTKRDIARAYLAGTPAKELAAEYGISVQKVIGIAQWYDRERINARRLAMALANPEPQKAAKPKIAAIQGDLEAKTYVVEKRYGECVNRINRVTLPLLSIQRRAA